MNCPRNSVSVGIVDYEKLKTADFSAHSDDFTPILH